MFIEGRNQGDKRSCLLKVVTKVIMVSACFPCVVEEELLKELEQAREGRKASERQREDLVKQAKMMQSKTQSRRNHGTQPDTKHAMLSVKANV